MAPAVLDIYLLSVLSRKIFPEQFLLCLVAQGLPGQLLALLWRRHHLPGVWAKPPQRQSSSCPAAWALMSSVGSWPRTLAEKGRWLGHCSQVLTSKCPLYHRDLKTICIPYKTEHFLRAGALSYLTSWHTADTRKYVFINKQGNEWWGWIITLDKFITSILFNKYYIILFLCHKKRKVLFRHKLTWT